jgi:hypothetical protein
MEKSYSGIRGGNPPQDVEPPAQYRHMIGKTLRDLGADFAAVHVHRQISVAANFDGGLRVRIR